MRILKGTLALAFQGETFDCPLAGVRDASGHVELAVAMPFGLRQVHAQLDADRNIAHAHTFAFDYESSGVTRFELEITGGAVTPDRRVFKGTVHGGGLEGDWEIRELGPFDDEAEEAEQAFHISARVPTEQTPAPTRGED